eukprot:scaffold112796_cov62-Attheya_sp.AAC.8
MVKLYPGTTRLPSILRYLEEASSTYPTAPLPVLIRYDPSLTVRAVPSRIACATSAPSSRILIFRVAHRLECLLPANRSVNIPGGVVVLFGVIPLLETDVCLIPVETIAEDLAIA